MPRWTSSTRFVRRICLACLPEQLPRRGAGHPLVDDDQRHSAPLDGRPPGGARGRRPRALPPARSPGRSGGPEPGSGRPVAGRRRRPRRAVQRHSPGQRRRVLQAASRRPRARPTGSPTRLPLGNTEWAAPTRPRRPFSTTKLAAHGGRRIRDPWRGQRGGDSDGAYRDWHGGLWADLATALNLPAAVGEPRRPRPAAVDHADHRQVTNTVIVSSRRGPPPCARTAS